jgi:hypothetical protein
MTLARILDGPPSLPQPTTQPVLHLAPSRLERTVGLIRLPPLAHHPQGGLLFLGRVWPFSLLTYVWKAELLTDPELLEMRAWLDLPGYLEKRSRYAQLLWQATQTPDSDQRSLAIAYEQHLWLRFDRAALVNVFARIEPLGEHMLWSSRSNPRLGRPVANAFGVHSVTVHRLLWPHFRPGEPLPANRNPKKNVQICPDMDIHRWCVNPLHYYLSERMEPAPNVRTVRGAPDGRVSTMPRWEEHADSRIYCQPFGHLLNDHAQQLFRDRGYGMPKFQYCGDCRRARLAQSPEMQIRGPAKQRERTYAEMRDGEEFLRAAWETGHINPA